MLYNYTNALIEMYYLFQTCSVDIFSSGCVFFYVLTKGKHPFGDDRLDIQYNIRRDQHNLDSLSKGMY